MFGNEQDNVNDYAKKIITLLDKWNIMVDLAFELYQSV